MERTEAIRTSDWAPPVPVENDGRYIFETTFDLPPMDPGAYISILLGAFSSGAKVTLNNRELPSDSAKKVSDTEFRLDPSKLLKSGNLLRLEAKPNLSPVDSETLGRFRPAFLRLVMPAAPWSRSVFNGLAQVIVQSTGEPGEVVLEAAGEGLRGAKLILTAEG